MVSVNGSLHPRGISLALSLIYPTPPLILPPHAASSPCPLPRPQKETQWCNISPSPHPLPGDFPPPANAMRWDIVVRTFMTRREEGRGEKGGKRNTNTIFIWWRNRKRREERDKQIDRQTEKVLILMHVFNSLAPLKTREQRREERKKETERERENVIV